ncbi:MAG: thermonuclease family protein [Myxococcota bacterium]|nr:thermonuclease family protein [Myxococcota bacterium]
MMLLWIASLSLAETTRSARVISVYDGDTFTLESGEKVRLAGVNTPELSPMEPYAIEARDATERFLSATEITLHLGATERDGYGRLIAGASVDGKSLSEHLIGLGLAHLFLIPPIEPGQSSEALLEAQAKARNANRGIWSNNNFRGDLHITSFHANAAGDDRENVNGEYLRVCNIASHPLSLEGYALTDASGNRWVLPAMTVPTGHTIRIHSGKGINQTDHKAQLTVYLGNPGPIWNNTYDKATLYDRYGRIMDMRVHEKK